MTLEDDLIVEVDRLAKELKTTRSAFTREALRQALRLHKQEALEEQHRRGYRDRPAAPGEFDTPETDRAWGDKW